MSFNLAVVESKKVLMTWSKYYSTTVAYEADVPFITNVNGLFVYVRYINLTNGVFLTQAS